MDLRPLRGSEGLVDEVEDFEGQLLYLTVPRMMTLTFWLSKGFLRDSERFSGGCHRRCSEAAATNLAQGSVFQKKKDLTCVQWESEIQIS